MLPHLHTLTSLPNKGHPPRSYLSKIFSIASITFTETAMSSFITWPIWLRQPFANHSNHREVLGQPFCWNFVTNSPRDLKLLTPPMDAIYTLCWYSSYLPFSWDFRIKAIATYWFTARQVASTVPLSLPHKASKLTCLMHAISTWLSLLGLHCFKFLKMQRSHVNGHTKWTPGLAQRCCTTSLGCPQSTPDSSFATQQWNLNPGSGA